MMRSSRKPKVPLKSAKSFVNTKEVAIVKIQCLVRRFVARRRVRAQAKAVWQRVFDPTYKKYFWFNKLDGLSYWTQSKYVTLFDDKDEKATKLLQRAVRSFVGRMKARKVAHTKYTRFYDAKVNKFYWMENKTQKTTWNVTPWLIKQNIPLPLEDQMLYESQMKIRELEARLLEKDREIKAIRKQRFEELEPAVMKDKLTNARAFKRGKNMDEWKVDEMAAFFTEMKMEQYVPFVFQNKVDGNLFLNLSETDWQDMGITNRFHIRKLILIMKAYRVRYMRKKEKVEIDDDDDMLSEYSPSELSAVIAAEDANNDAATDDDSYDDRSFASDESDPEEVTDEQRQEKKLDEKNIQITLMVRGDATNFPMVGDIVRVRYTATIADTNKVVMSTKNVMEKPWVEFVLGIDQVIKGFDRALPQMSVGERSKLTFTSEYAYGSQGLLPHIPPNTALSFDLTLLGFRARSMWVKPLIQTFDTQEHPYHIDAKISLELMHGRSNADRGSGNYEDNDAGGGGGDADSFSTALGGKTKRVSNFKK